MCCHGWLARAVAIAGLAFLSGSGQATDGKLPTSPVHPEPSEDSLPIDLPTALRVADASNPTIALARERMNEALARLRQAEVLWLPNLVMGPAYQRHDGRLQNSRGEVLTVSKSNFFMGGGAALRLELADALFGPIVARRLSDAQAAAARTVDLQVQLDVALTYFDLLQAHGLLAVNAETLFHAEEMLRNAEAAQQAGKSKTPADAPRARTEVELRRQERIELEGQAGVVSARLAQLLLLQPTVELRPADPAIVPLELVPAAGALDEWIATGLMNRPELAESRSLVAAAMARWRQSRVGPFVPRLEVSYLAGDFGGGRNDVLSNFDGRGDGSAQAVWEFHNLGAGDLARTRERRAQVNVANWHVVEVESQVAAEIAATARMMRARQRELASAQEAVRQAFETWRRLREAAFGLAGPDRRYDPLEPLLAEQALATARRQYLLAIIEHNKAQYRLFTAMGQPAVATASPAPAVPTVVPAVPALK